MSIRPNQNRRSVADVLRDGMAANPPASVRPKVAYPAEAYEVTYDGERYVGVPYRSTEYTLSTTRISSAGTSTNWLLVRPGDGEVVGVHTVRCDDDAVSDLVRLVPARPVTRDDLPAEEDIQALASRRVSHGESTWGLILDAVVGRLNERGGVPAEAGSSCCADAAQSRAEVERLTADLATARAEGRAAHDNWMNAAGRAGKAEAERDGWKRQLLDVVEVSGKQYDELKAERDRAVTELARRNEELAERDEEIAALNKKLDEFTDPYSEVNQKAAAWGRIAGHPIIGPLETLPESDSYSKQVGKRLDELQAKLDARPTLDREAVRRAIDDFLPDCPIAEVDKAIAEIVALAPSWPEWLGPVPEKPRIVHKDGELTVAGKYSLLDDADLDYVREAAWARLVLADAHEKKRAEQAEPDEDQRIEKQAVELWKRTHLAGETEWDNASAVHKMIYRRVVRDGVTGPKEGQA